MRGPVQWETKGHMFVHEMLLDEAVCSFDVTGRELTIAFLLILKLVKG